MTLSSVFGMFAKSPIRPIQEHMSKANACAQELLAFIEAAISENWEKAGEIQSKITKLERDADILKKELRLSLPTGIFMPVPRGDILALLKSQDEVANKAEDIAGLMLGRKMSIPKELQAQFIHYVKRALESVAQADKAISELSELLETGFSGTEIALIEELIVQLEAIESDTDRCQVTIRQHLFEIEKQLSPIDAMFLYKIIDWIGDLADEAQHVGNRLELFLAH